MSVDICACGHPIAAHAIRHGEMADETLRAKGESVCNFCYCPKHLHAVKVESRSPFRAAQRSKVGNTGSSHPLLVGISKSEGAVEWYDIECASCGLPLIPSIALVLDSAFLCGDCYLKRPEVYCDFV